MEDSEAVDIPKPCRLDLQELAEASQLRPDLEASVVASAEDLAALHAVAAFEEVSEVTGAALVVEEVVSGTKAEAVLVAEEVGMAVERPTATVMAKQHPRMHLLALAETVEALLVGMVARLQTGLRTALQIPWMGLVVGMVVVSQDAMTSTTDHPIEEVVVAAVTVMAAQEVSLAATVNR